MSVLALEKVSKSFGAVVVADGLDMTVDEGEALGVIGPNGAGKTTMFNLITGTVGVDAGHIAFNGGDITHQAAATRCRGGIARSFQVPQPFGAMTVFENTLVAATQGADLSLSAANEICLEVLDTTGLIAKANDRAGGLTLLERKRLELARALCARPKLLLLDEIAGGLSEPECKDLVQTITKISDDGMTIIWIEHVVHALLAVVDRLVVIDFGAKIADGDPRQTMASALVQKIYMGIEVDA